MIARRDRTRQLIELGGLVQKSGLVDRFEDDRAVIFGMLLQLRNVLDDDDADERIARWRRMGRMAFDADELAEAEARAARKSSAPVVVG